MAELARIGLAVAPACPNCRNRLSDLPLGNVAAGDAYQCPFCSEVIRIPQQVLDRLRDQRETLRREQAHQPSWLQRALSLLRKRLGLT